MPAGPTNKHMNPPQHQHHAGNYFIVNGQYEPRVTLRPQEVVRLRLINGGASSTWVLTPCVWVCILTCVD